MAALLLTGNVLQRAAPGVCPTHTRRVLGVVGRGATRWHCRGLWSFHWVQSGTSQNKWLQKMHPTNSPLVTCRVSLALSDEPSAAIHTQEGSSLLTDTRR